MNGISVVNIAVFLAPRKVVAIGFVIFAER